MSSNQLDVELHEMRENFETELKKNSKKHQDLWDSKRIAETIQKLEEYENAIPSQRSQDRGILRFRSMYEVKTLDGKKVLTHKMNNSQLHKIVRIAPTEEYFDILLEAHRKTMHGRCDKMTLYLKDYVYIPLTAIVSFLKHCKVCEHNRSWCRGQRPLNSRSYKRGVLHIVDMSKTPDENDHVTFKYIMFYQDIQTKFSYIVPLPDDSPIETAKSMLNMCLELDGPEILSTTRDTEFTESVITYLKKMMPDMMVLIGVTVSPEKFEEYDESIRRKLQTWMRQNESSKWSLGIYFVQYKMNNTYDNKLKRTPFNAMFGVSQKKGIDTKGVPIAIIKTLKTEEDLIKWRATLKIRKSSKLRKRLERLKKFKHKINEDEQKTSCQYEDSSIAGPSTESLERLKKFKHKINEDEQKTSCQYEDSSIAGPSTEKKSGWFFCKVCRKEDEEVTFQCHSCNAVIHNTCGKYNDTNTIECNMCLTQVQAIKYEEVKVEFEWEPTDLHE